MSNSNVNHSTKVRMVQLFKRVKRVANGLTLVVGDGGLVMCQSALGQRVRVAGGLSLSVGRFGGGELDRESALGQTATAVALLTVGGQVNLRARGQRW